MRVFYKASLGDRKRLKVEGMLSVIDVLYEGLRKKFDITFKLRKKVDLVHMHSSGFQEALNANYKAPIIYSVHAYLRGNILKTAKDIFDWYTHIDYLFKDVKQTSKYLPRLLMRLVSYCIPMLVKRHFLRKVDAIVVSSKLAKQELNLPNTHVIPHAIQEKRFVMRKQNKNVAVGYAGHTTPAKGVIEVAKVFGKLPYKTDMYLTFTPERFLNYVKKKSPRTTVHGRVDDVAQIYKKSDIMLLPFRHKNAAIATPLVLIEAMASGCAIVTTDLPYLRELCGDSVIYVKKYDLGAMVKTINRLATNPALRKKLGAKARKQALKNHKEKDMILTYEKLYNSFRS